jgi:hypothetical protein
MKQTNILRKLEREFRDCFGIWEERKILDALPDEAKDLKKQKAG